MTREAMTQMLRREMVPALGCTGPTAYALAAACCRPHLTGEVTGMDVYVSPAFLKIGFGVATPGTPEPGIAIASAIGLLGGDMTRGLEVLESAGPEDVKRAHEMVEEGKVRVLCDWEQTGVYVRAEVQTHKERVAAVVAGTHDGIQGVWVDGRPVLENPPASEELTEEEAGLNLEMIFDYVEHCRPGELRFLLEGYRMNAALAEDGLKQPFGLCSGRAHLRDTFPAGQIPEAHEPAAQGRPIGQIQIVENQQLVPLVHRRVNFPPGVGNLNLPPQAGQGKYLALSVEGNSGSCHRVSSCPAPEPLERRLPHLLKGTVCS